MPRPTLRKSLARTSRSSKPPAGLLQHLEPRVLFSTTITHVLPVSPFGSVGVVGFTPSQIRTAYNVNNISFGSSGIVGDGSGQTIAILDSGYDSTIAADFAAFNSTFTPTATGALLTPIVESGTPAATSDESLEIALDVEWAHAIAPGANILLVEYTNGDAFSFGLPQAKAVSGVSVISMSFGLSAGEISTETSLDSLFTTPTGHRGITFVASSGDSGTVSYPASSPNVLAVGGTALGIDGSNNYVSEYAWSGSGGGYSAYESRPAYQDSVSSNAHRGTPDVAFDADPSTGVAVYTSSGYGSSSAPWVNVGGTSVGAPAWAGILALINQGRTVQGLDTLHGPSQTLPMIYSLPSADFHDITSGSNGTFSAGTGYDLVTGRGTPIVNKLVHDMLASQQFLVTARGASGGSTQVHAIDTQTNNTYSFNPYASYSGAINVAQADFTGDGIADFAFSPRAGDTIKVIDGAIGGGTAAVLWSFTPFGAGVININIAAADVTGDGIADVVVSAGGHVAVYDGATKSSTPVWNFQPFTSGYTGDIQIAAGDLNNDGYADLIVTAAGNVAAFSGAGTHSQLWTSFQPFGTPFVLPIYVAIADLDGNGTNEFVISGYNAVAAYEGSTKANLYNSYYPWTTGYAGSIRLGAGNILGHGHAQLGMAATINEGMLLNDGLGTSPYKAFTETFGSTGDSISL